MLEQSSRATQHSPSSSRRIQSIHRYYDVAIKSVLWFLAYVVLSGVSSNGFMAGFKNRGISTSHSDDVFHRSRGITRIKIPSTVTKYGSRRELKSKKKNDDLDSDKKSKRNWFKRVFQKDSSSNNPNPTTTTTDKTKKEKARTNAMLSKAIASALGKREMNGDGDDDTETETESKKERRDAKLADKSMGIIIGEEQLLQLRDAVTKEKDDKEKENAALLPKRNEKRKETDDEIKKRRKAMEKAKKELKKLEQSNEKQKKRNERREKERTTSTTDVAEDDLKKDGGGGDNIGTILANAQNFVSGVWDNVIRSKSSPSSDEEWIVVCPKRMIAPGQMIPVTVAGIDLLIVATKDGSRLHCIANSCPHLGTPLETGLLEKRPGCGDCIVCPTHKTAFALEDGEVEGEWCPYPPIIGTMMGNIKQKSKLPTFCVRARGKNIEVRLNSIMREDDNDDGAKKKKG